MITNHTDSDAYAGVYVHIPFCVHKCPYCDFYSISGLSYKDPFLNALIKEIEMVRDVADVCDTIYLGGGTPSLFNGKDISTILETVYSFYNIRMHAEITIEVNPGTVDIEKFKSYKTAGVNRIAIGVQSFRNSNLTFLGRIHTKDDATSAISRARKTGFDNIGLDLIYGLPGQSRDEWITDLQTAIDHAPEHISCYMLTYEKNTDMWRKMKNKSFRPLPDEQMADLFKTTIEVLEKNGYYQYELSNFAKSSSTNTQKNISRHNKKYWSFAPYLGFGPSAHSYIAPDRFWNVRSLKKYIGLLNKGKRPIGDAETLTDEQMMTEAIYLGLRKTDGIDIHAYNQKFNVTFTDQFDEIIKELKKEELIFVNEKRCCLSRKGMLFIDSIVPMFMDNIP